MAADGGPCAAQQGGRDGAAGRQQAYATAKREAAAVWGNDRAACTEAKSAVILGTLDQAEAWAAGTRLGIRD